MAWCTNLPATSVRSVLKESTNTQDQIIYRGKDSTPRTLKPIYIITELNKTTIDTSASITPKKT